MSFGNGYNGGRTRMGTQVFLNVYDLSPMNDCLFQIGFGLHHSGVEIMGREYSFGSGGGIFESTPREAGGAPFRLQLDMGSYEGGSKELNRALDDLRTSGFGNSDYNLIYKNCNHFSNALVWKLLKVQIPGYVNRLAYLGSTCSCLLPKQLIEDSPVGGNGNQRESSDGSSFLVPTRASMNRGPTTISSGTNSFEGKGYSLISQKDNSSSFWPKSSPRSQGKDDLTDRRERARKAALARLEQSKPQES